MIRTVSNYYGRHGFSFPLTKHNESVVKVAARHNMLLRGFRRYVSDRVAEKIMDLHNVSADHIYPREYNEQEDGTPEEFKNELHKELTCDWHVNPDCYKVEESRYDEEHPSAGEICLKVIAVEVEDTCRLSVHKWRKYAHINEVLQCEGIEFEVHVYGTFGNLERPDLIVDDNLLPLLWLEFRSAAEEWSPVSRDVARFLATGKLYDRSL